MNLRRFHTTDLHLPTVTLDRDQARHAIKVLRLNTADTVELFDGQGASATGPLQISGHHATIQITERHQTPPPSPTVHLAIAFPKGPRAAAMIETLSELGASRITPLITARTIVNPRDKKIDKLQRIALESAKQCRRNHTLQIDPPVTFDSLIKDADHTLKLIADTNNPADQQNIHTQLNTLCQPHSPSSSDSPPCILILVGPEGGFTDPERASAKAANFLPWSLGPHPMRIATAAAAATALLRQIR